MWIKTSSIYMIQIQILKFPTQPELGHMFMEVSIVYLIVGYCAYNCWFSHFGKTKFRGLYKLEKVVTILEFVEDFNTSVIYSLAASILLISFLFFASAIPVSNFHVYFVLPCLKMRKQVLLMKKVLRLLLQNGMLQLIMKRESLRFQLKSTGISWKMLMVSLKWRMWLLLVNLK